MRWKVLLLFLGHFATLPLCHFAFHCLAVLSLHSPYPLPLSLSLALSLSLSLPLSSVSSSHATTPTKLCCFVLLCWLIWGSEVDTFPSLFAASLFISSLLFSSFDCPPDRASLSWAGNSVGGPEPAWPCSLIFQCRRQSRTLPSMLRGIQSTRFLRLLHRR